MDELLILLVRWLVRKMGDSGAGGTRRLPPAWTTAGMQQGVGARRQPTVVPAPGRRPPPLRVAQPAQPIAPTPMQGGKNMKTVKPSGPAQVAQSRREASSVRASMSASTLRRQWAMYELLQPPIALRPPTE